MSTHRTNRSWRRRIAAVTLTALLAAPLAACGEDPESSPTAADQVPALATQLDRIDQALAGKRFEQARTLLERLTRQVIRAREAGSLDPAAADRILGAISRLRAELPEPKPEPVPTVTVTPPPPRNDDGGDRGDEKDEEQKQAEEARKKAEEARKKAEEERRKEKEERRKDQEEKDDD